MLNEADLLLNIGFFKNDLENRRESRIPMGFSRNLPAFFQHSEIRQLNFAG